jgi:hypothetical protein
MATKVQYSEISKTLSDLSTASYKVHGSYSHVAGYYESTLVGLISDLPAHKQREMMRLFQDRIKSLQEIA